MFIHVYFVLYLVKRKGWSVGMPLKLVCYSDLSSHVKEPQNCIYCLKKKLYQNLKAKALFHTNSKASVYVCNPGSSKERNSASAKTLWGTSPVWAALNIVCNQSKWWERCHGRGDVMTSWYKIMCDAFLTAWEHDVATVTKRVKYKYLCICGSL